MQASPLLLSARALACRRADRMLFAGLDLALAPGAALHLAGANGIGKSSLMRILAGLAAPFAGTVERHGPVALVQEKLALDGSQPLGRALAFWAGIDGADPGPHAARLGLADLLDVPVRYLSTGQRKRAALARLLGQQAAIWLLDEPLNGLDTQGCALVGALVAEHIGTGGACLIASHQPFALPAGALPRLELAGFVPAPESGEWA